MRLPVVKKFPMCGFLGVYGQRGYTPQELQNFRKKAACIAHRGNTGKGELVEESVALFHYRLAFRGLSDGVQPLTDLAGRATILFNGELYAYSALREALVRDYQFRSHADTEVILAAYLLHGPEKFLSLFDGEYAFAIWDRKESALLAARDPFGVKPIFLASEGLQGTNGDFFRQWKHRYEFSVEGKLQLASEMKGLAMPLRWERRGMERQLFGLYEEICTPFSGVIQIPPGALLTAKRTESGFRCVIERKIEKRRARAKRTKKSFSESAEDLKKIIGRAVQAKLDAEVPLGAYLSGGIDSRIAAYEMARAGTEIPAFTVGFEGKDFDETNEVSTFLKAYPNLRGRVLRTTNQALEYAYPHAIYASELVQPYTNGAAKWWLSRFARRHVRGVLTGDGSDEIFCGYPSYRYLAWWRFYSRQPTAARASLYAARVGGHGEKFWEKGLSSLENGDDLKDSFRHLGWHHPLFAQIAGMAQSLLGEKWEAWLLREKESIGSYTFQDKEESPLRVWQNYFLHTHFPTHILNWVGDRMEMANTLEGRPIFLSQEILHFMESMPDHYLVRGMRDKAVLRAAYAKELSHFSRAPKKQFNAPFLQDGSLLNEFLSEENIRRVALLEPGDVARIRQALSSEQDPLQKSYLSMILQNILVLHMLDRYLVRGESPERNLEFEEGFLDEKTEAL